MKDIYVRESNFKDYPKQMVYLYLNGHIKTIEKSCYYLMYLCVLTCENEFVENAKFLLYFIITGYRNLEILKKLYFKVRLKYMRGSKYYYHLDDGFMYEEMKIIIGNNCAIYTYFWILKK